MKNEILSSLCAHWPRNWRGGMNKFLLSAGLGLEIETSLSPQVQSTLSQENEEGREIEALIAIVPEHLDHMENLYLMIFFAEQLPHLIPTIVADSAYWGPEQSWKYRALAWLFTGEITPFNKETRKLPGEMDKLRMIAREGEKNLVIYPKQTRSTQRDLAFLQSPALAKLAMLTQRPLLFIQTENSVPLLVKNDGKTGGQVLKERMRDRRNRQRVVLTGTDMLVPPQVEIRQPKPLQSSQGREVPRFPDVVDSPEVRDFIQHFRETMWRVYFASTSPLVDEQKRQLQAQ